MHRLSQQESTTTQAPSGVGCTLEERMISDDDVILLPTPPPKKRKTAVEDSPVRTTMSFDFGENATAYCLGDPTSDPPRITDIGISTLGMVTTARDAVVAIRDLVSRLPIVDTYVVEEQPRINPRTCMMETALAAIAGTLGATVVHVPTSRLTTEFSLPSGHAQRKAEASRLLSEFRGDGDAVAFSDRALAVVDSVGRKHDIADATLYFVWYARRGMAEVGAALDERVDDGSVYGLSYRATAPQNARAGARREGVRKMALHRKFSSVITSAGPGRTRRRAGVKKKEV